MTDILFEVAIKLSREFDYIDGPRDLLLTFVHKGQNHNLILHMKHEERSWLKWQANHAKEKKRPAW